MLRGLDWFGEGEAALDIYKLLPHFVRFLGSPAFSGLAIAGGFAGLIWQEVRRSRVPDAIPRHQLVHWDTKLPISSKPRAGCTQFRHPFHCYAVTLCKVMPSPGTTLCRHYWPSKYHPGRKACSGTNAGFLSFSKPRISTVTNW